jgi:hypothetical protein
VDTLRDKTSSLGHDWHLLPLQVECEQCASAELDNSTDEENQVDNTVSCLVSNGISTAKKRMPGP